MTLVGLDGQALTSAPVVSEPVVGNTVGPIRLPAPSDLPRWQRECRDLFGQPNAEISWAHLDWYADQGVNRLVVFQMVPLARASFFSLSMYGEAEPEWKADGTAKGAPMTRLGWDLFHREHAVPTVFWIIEGPNGGHKYRFSRRERAMCKLARLPADPPVPGSQPYAPWDNRVITALKAIDRLQFWNKAMDLADRSPEMLDEDEKQAEREMREAYTTWLERQVDAAADSVSSLTRPLVSDDMVSRDVAPIDADRMRHEYIHSV